MDAGGCANGGAGTCVKFAAAGAEAPLAFGAAAGVPRTIFAGVVFAEVGSGYFAMNSGFNTK